MTKQLYKFLKSKGDRFEFCYKDKEPFLVCGYIDTDLMEEYARKKSHTRNVLQEIFGITAGPWDDPVISEELYNKMKNALS